MPVCAGFLSAVVVERCCNKTTTVVVVAVGVERMRMRTLSRRRSCVSGVDDMRTNCFSIVGLCLAAICAVSPMLRSILSNEIGGCENEIAIETYNKYHGFRVNMLTFLNLISLMRAYLERDLDFDDRLESEDRDLDLDLDLDLVLDLDEREEEEDGDE